MKHFLCWISVLLSLMISSVQAADIQGLWKVEIAGFIHTDWIIGVNNGFIYGSSYWDDGQQTNDKLNGTVNGNQVSITRYLSAPNVGKTQTFTGTVNGTSLSGTCAGTSVDITCSWTATITPLATSIVTCPTPPPIDECPVPPVDKCPVPPVCPTPITGDCIATYNAETGRFTAPCVAVPVTQPFGITQILNYSIEMQQRTGVYTFDLDLNTVKQR